MLEDKISQYLNKRPFDNGAKAVSDPEPLFAIATDIGRIRNENQDRVAAMWVDGGRGYECSFFCVAVCDGMGGMKEGAKSATTAISSFFQTLIEQRELPVENRLNTAAKTANKTVYERIKGGGTTLSAVLFEDETVHLINVGDSRIYIATGSGDKVRIERATKDDNMKEVFGEQGEGLLQYIGMGEGINPHVSIPLLDFRSLLITTDGAHAVGDEMLTKVYSHAGSLSEAARRLVALSRWLGGQDNATAALVSNAALDYRMKFQEDSQIVLWSPFDRFQFTWAMPSREMLPQPESLSTQHNKENASKRGTNKVKSSGKPKRQKAKRVTGEKVQFDFGIEATKDDTDR